MQFCFAGGMDEALRASGVVDMGGGAAGAAAGPDAAREAGSPSTVPGKLTPRSYQDDTYFTGSLEIQIECLPAVADALRNVGGHEVVPAKSGSWVPRLDPLDDAVLSAAAQSFFETYPRNRGGLPALGAAVGGDLEAFVTAQAVTTSAAEKRLDKFIVLAEKLEDFADSVVDDGPAHMACMVLARGAARVHDYDARLVPFTGAGLGARASSTTSGTDSRAHRRAPADGARQEAHGVARPSQWLRPEAPRR